ncbi:unnamed protein product [Bathycoccus prasinos]
MRRTLLKRLRLSLSSASASSTRSARFRSTTTTSACSSSGRRSGRSDPGASSSSIAAHTFDVKERRLRFFLSPSSSFTSSQERAFGNDRRQQQQQQQQPRGRKLYATNTRADEDEEAQKKNQGGDEDDGKNNVTRRSVTNIIVRPKSAVDLEQGEMRDKTVPIHASTHIVEEKESSFDEKIVLPGRHFDVPIRIDIAHRCVRWQLARKRGVSTAKTKSRGEVSGTTRKARPQKGGGRARVGSLRAPQMRGGGTAHGPIPRDFEHKLQKKVRRLGLRVALSAKAAEGRLVVVEDLKWMSPTGKTKEAKFGLKQLLRYDDSSEEEDELNHMRLSPSPLVIGGTGDSGNKINTKFSALVVGDRLETTDESDDGWLLRRGTRNIENIHVMPSVGLNVYSILKHRCLVMTKKAVEELVERLDKPINR